MAALLLYGNIFCDDFARRILTNIKLIRSAIKRILKTTKQDRATHSMLSAAFVEDNEVQYIQDISNK